MSTPELQQRSPVETHTADPLFILPLGSPSENTGGNLLAVGEGQCSPYGDQHKLSVSAVGTVCAVCGDVAPTGSTYRRHYGVICCEACKCFFRRTVQMNRDYKCRYGSNCSVGRSPVNMKQVCQACRFNQCVKAGMKIDSVKKFPRKGRDEGITGFKTKAKQKGPKTSRAPTAKADAAKQSPAVLLPQVKGEEGSDFEDHFEQIKLTSSSPETTYSTFDSGIPQLFNYDTVQENPLMPSPLKTTPGTVTSVSRTDSTSSASPKDSPQHVRKVSFESEAAHVKRGGGGGGAAEASNTVNQLKKPKLESARVPLLQSSAANSCRITSSELPVSVSSLVSGSASSTPYTTPHGTPCHSPLPSSSPTHQFKYYSNVSTSQGEGVAGPYQYHPSCSQMDSPSPAQLGHLSVTLPSRVNSASGNIIFSGPSAAGTFLPFHVLPVGQVGSPLFPMVHLAGPFPPQTAGSNQSMIGKSPFHMVPIPTNSKLVNNGSSGLSSPESISHHPSPFITMAKSELVPDELTCSSSQNSPGMSKLLAGNSFLEAEVEEVLDSLRLRIRHMFKWAKFEVMGFEDLSPLDQKALLRRTVAELVMLGFARGSIPYDGLLVLGSTGKVIRPRNPNSGVATVASVTLQKLVVPLQALNIDEKELNLLKEIVLFNPEADGLRNREVVRQYRKRKHIELMEYTEKGSEPGRFGELLCLLPPLFEVSMEVTEQLRLEQFVHEGEARIDALLLMSMIHGVDETAENVAES